MHKQGAVKIISQMNPFLKEKKNKVSKLHELYVGH